jgi:hypothetical protein
LQVEVGRVRFRCNWFWGNSSIDSTLFHTSFYFHFFVLLSLSFILPFVWYYPAFSWFTMSLCMCSAVCHVCKCRGTWHLVVVIGLFIAGCESAVC